MLLGTAQSLIDGIFASGIAMEARNARDLLNVLVMPLALGTGGLAYQSGSLGTRGLDLLA
jgi:predicted RNA methylase